MADAKAAQEAGAFAMVLECISAEIAAVITAEVDIPTIGIGSGVDCDGQILVMHDLLGLTEGRVPKHVKAYAQLRESIQGSISQYRDEVRNGQFPGQDQSFR